jgi:hypothetical protein
MGIQAHGPDASKEAPALLFSDLVWQLGLVGGVLNTMLAPVNVQN